MTWNFLRMMRNLHFAGRPALFPAASIAHTLNFFPIRNFLHRQMRRLADCVGRDCQEVTPPLPLTRKEAQRLRVKKRREAREREREREKAQKERGGRR